MKTKTITALVSIFAFVIACTIIAQEKIERKHERKLKAAEAKLKEHEHRLHSITIPEIHIDMSHLETSMQHLEQSLQHLEHIEIPEIYVPDIYVPDIHIPDIYVPEIDLAFDQFDLNFDFDFDFDDGFIYYEDGDWDHSNLFEDLSDEEQLKIAALRSISRQYPNKAIPAIEEVIKEDPNPALRYEAVRHLRRFLDDKRVVPILGKVAKNDKNVDVRKKAIYLLGKSGDKRAVKILEELAER